MTAQSIELSEVDTNGSAVDLVFSVDGIHTMEVIERDGGALVARFRFCFHKGALMSAAVSGAGDEVGVSCSGVYEISNREQTVVAPDEARVRDGIQVAPLWVFFDVSTDRGVGFGEVGDGGNSISYEVEPSEVGQRQSLMVMVKNRDIRYLPDGPIVRVLNCLSWPVQVTAEFERYGKIAI
ncbi:MAG: hypothetical protein WC846_00570 [Candidatus Gracilibacteria bacterium]|jgi:hypothetical protein